MKIIIDKNDYASYNDSTYKGFYDILAKEFKINNLNYNTDNLYEFLWGNRFVNINFIFIGFNLSEIIDSNKNDNLKWKEIISEINDMAVRFSNITLTFKDCTGEFVKQIIIDRANYKDYGYYTFKGFYTEVYKYLTERMTLNS